MVVESSLAQVLSFRGTLSETIADDKQVKEGQTERECEKDLQFWSFSSVWSICSYMR